MNFYKHHLGDYLAATRHLSLLEHGIYRSLIDLYYIHEAPLPIELKTVCRLICARSNEEIEAVELILNEFFEKADDGWHSARCDREIGLAREKAERNREVGRMGGRPKKTETQPADSGNPEITQMVSDQNPQETLASNHKPVTSNHKPEKRDSRARESSPPPDAASSVLGEVCRAIKGAGVTNINTQHPKLLAIIEAGGTADEFREAAVEAVQRGKASFAYVLAVVANRREEAASLALHRGSMPERPRRKTLSEARAETIATLTGASTDERTTAAERDITGESRRLA